MFISDNSARVLVSDMRNAHLQVLTQKDSSPQVQILIHLNEIFVVDYRMH